VKRILNATRLLLTVQKRSGFLHVYFGVALATVLAVRLILPESLYPKLVPAVLLGEYGTMGIFMVAALRYLERIEGSAAALIVTPLRHPEHVAAMIIAPGMVATLAGVLVFAGVLGPDRRSFWLVPPLFLTTCLAGATGLILAARYREFTAFLIGSVPVTAIVSLPFLSFFELVPRLTFVWLPWDASLFSFANLARPSPEATQYLLQLFELLLFSIGAFLWAERSLRTRLVAYAEAA
jgi:fluoroquinolone transport system permease protein